MSSIKLYSRTLALVLLPIALTLSSHLKLPAAGDLAPTQSPPPGPQELLSEPTEGRGNTTRSSEEEPHLGRVTRNQEHEAGHQQRVLAYLKGHGRFSSDTSSCADIESRSCSRISECRGCLGLYTCNIPLAKCELKGVSRKTAGFIQNARQDWMAEVSE